MRERRTEARIFFLSRNGEGKDCLDDLEFEEELEDARFFCDKDRILIEDLNTALVPGESTADLAVIRFES